MPNRNESPASVPVRGQTTLLKGMHMDEKLPGDCKLTVVGIFDRGVQPSSNKRLMILFHTKICYFPSPFTVQWLVKVKPISSPVAVLTRFQSCRLVKIKPVSSPGTVVS